MSRTSIRTPSSPVGRKLIAGTNAFLQALLMGEAAEHRFTDLTVELSPEPRAFKPEDVKPAQGYFRASRAVFVHLLQ